MTGSAGAPALIACGHGTRSPVGAAAVAGLVDAVRTALPGVDVREASVDVQRPRLDEALRTLAHRRAVVVPLLLSTGRHVRHDIGRAVAAAPRHVAAAPLGPHPALVELLAERLAQAGLRHDDAVVLGASASSAARARADLRATAASLSARLGRPVGLGHVGHCGPALAEVVAASRRSGRRVVVAAGLLAPGSFYEELGRSGADVAAAPLLDGGPPDRRLVALVVDRYAQAIGDVAAQAG